MKITEKENYIEVSDIPFFSPFHTFECGQCFRWQQDENGVYFGIAFGKAVKICCKSNVLYISCNKRDFEEIWCKYLDLERNYVNLAKGFANDDFTKKAVEYGNGLRILAQEPWEALCSFIFSQCNNISRIKSIIDRFCTLFGDEISFEGQIYHAFPSATRVATLTLDDLAPLRCGYRAPYVLSAATAVANGTLSFDRLKALDTPTARKELLRLNGVGAKVADCFLLFGLFKLDAFPVDTWMKKAGNFYDGKFDGSAFGEYAGIAQQYIFYYARSTKIGK